MSQSLAKVKPTSKPNKHSRKPKAPGDHFPKTVHSNESTRVETTTAKLFQNGRSQAVRLPKEFRFDGASVQISRVGNGVLLEPLASTPHNWLEVFAAMDAISTDDPMPGRRNQGVTESKDIFPDD